MITQSLRIGYRFCIFSFLVVVGLLQGCVTVDLLSVSTDQSFGNHFSTAPSISLDGNYVAFMSRATNLVDGYTLNPNVHQCYVRDIRNQTTEIVSISTNGIVADNDCVDPKISDDGRYVVFASDSDKLDPNAVGRVRIYTSQIYIRDRVAGTTKVISLPETIPYVENVEPELVPDGRSAYYFNYRPTSYVGDPDFGRRIYHHIQSTGNSEPFKAATASAIDARHLQAARLGDWVAFESKESMPFTHRDGSVFPVVPDDTTTKIYLYHYPTNKLYLASNSYWLCYVNGCAYKRFWKTPNGESVYPSISPTGTRVAFETTASSLIHQTTIPGSGDRNDLRDIYLYDRNRWGVASQDEIYGVPYIRRVSVSSEGDEGDGDSRTPSLGRAHVAFSSTATNLVDDDDNGKSDIFRHDLSSSDTHRVSIQLTYDEDGYGSIVPSISENGKRIAFAVSGGHSYDIYEFGHTPDGQVYLYRDEWVIIRFINNLFASRKQTSKAAKSE